jgi:hypothetical protein
LSLETDQQFPKDDAMKADHRAHDTEGHAQRLAEALGALVQQSDISDYRDSKGHPAKNNLAFHHAQALVDEFGVSHEDICRVLDSCGDDLSKASHDLIARIPGAEVREARPSDTPPECGPHTGP